MSDTEFFSVPEILRSRRITGMSAVLLPLTSGGDPDWDAFEAHVHRTLDASLIPAVNMDTGYVNLLDDATKAEVLKRTGRIASGREFVAGTFVADRPGDPFNISAYARGIEQIRQAGGIPVIFQSHGLTEQNDDEIIAAYRSIGELCETFIAFELGTMFAPFGRIYSLDVYRGLLEINACVGAKHSSLQRVPEWQRLALRNQVRPDFRVLTGNDLAIDMVMYGSDYLLGLSSFAPDLFAKRDAMWACGDPAFHQLNDVLQYLGFFAFRNPVPAYKHSCAQFLHLRGMIRSDRTHPESPSRPDSDIPVLREILRQLEEL
ncbi:MAG: dihydrodipicolinate synthase family protein [Planctomycetaceae bacterium]